MAIGTIFLPLSFPGFPTGPGSPFAPGFPNLPFDPTQPITSCAACTILPSGIARDACEAALCRGNGGGSFAPDPIIVGCLPGHTRIDGICVDATPGLDTPAELGATSALHPNGHRDHVPAITDVRTRRCRKGSVLGTDGWCHPKGTIRNADREYPKPPRPLGTRGDMKAVRVASTFGRRLVANKKRLKKLEQNLKKATC